MANDSTATRAIEDLDPRIERAVEAFNGQDLDAMMAQFATGGTYADPVEEDGISGDEIREYCADLFVAFPDLHVEVDRVVADEDATAYQCTFTGTHGGPMQGIPPTGRSISVPAVTVITLSDDGITSWRDYWDQQTFAEQLGLTFPGILRLLPGMVVAKLRDLV